MSTRPTRTRHVRTERSAHVLSQRKKAGHQTRHPQMPHCILPACGRKRLGLSASGSALAAGDVLTFTCPYEHAHVCTCADMYMGCTTAAATAAHWHVQATSSNNHTQPACMIASTSTGGTGSSDLKPCSTGHQRTHHSPAKNTQTVKPARLALIDKHLR